jgi:hypothetical protein
MSQIETIEIERTPGFTNVEGSDEGVSYNSANQAFYAYLEAIGKPRTPENKALFKEWLAKAKASGKLDKVLKGVKPVEKVIEQDIKTEELSATGDDKPVKKILGMPPVLGVAVIVAVVGLASWGIYTYVKSRKKAA